MRPPSAAPAALAVFAPGQHGMAGLAKDMVGLVLAGAVAGVLV